MAAFDKNLEQCLYLDWMSLHEQELSDLNHALKLREEVQLNDAEMKQVGKILQHLYKTVWRNNSYMVQPI